MQRRKLVAAIAGALALAAAAVALIMVFAVQGEHEQFSKFAVDPDRAAASNSTERPGPDPIVAYEAQQSAERTYPANVIPPQVVQRAERTWDRIRGFHDNDSEGRNSWQRYGPTQNAVQPGVLDFSGATSTTASRVTAMVISPSCSPSFCRLWVGVSGGGVWRTDDALSSNPTWTWLTEGIAQNSVGALTLDPTDPRGNTLYLGTGEANRCSSGCEAGVGIYRSTDGGNSWSELSDTCVSNAVYACVTPGQDAFLGRGISKIVIDPTNPRHIFVGSALGVRGLSHTIGNGGQTRLEPGANQPGLYESNDGGQTFTEVWNGNDPSSFGVTDVALDPRDPTTVYASAFDQGAWRRSPSLDGAASPTDFRQVFAPQFAGGGTDRTMFAPTTRNGTTRMYLTDGTANANGRTSPTAAKFWRTDNANQPAATLLASEATGDTEPAATGPTTYPAWQRLSSSSTSSPYFPTIDFCTGQCWYDEDVYTPQGRPDTVYVIGSFQYGEVPCTTKGVGCGNGRSNGRAVLLSTTAGDPDPAANERTFTDLTYDAQDNPASWCALPGISSCLHAPDSIHPDQHTIVVNPSNPDQIFEGSDGGVIRTDGQYRDTSSQCATERKLSDGSLLACQRMLSRIPNRITHVNQGLDTLQFVGVAINPAIPCEVQGGTQDNGSWSNPGCETDTWPQVIYGDGGNQGYDSAQPTWRFNEFTSAFTDSNFENGSPTKWVITSGPLVRSKEAIAFYWPQVSDPNPPPGTHPIFSGLQHVWRSWAFGAGTPGKVPQDTRPDVAGYEANCPEFTTGGDDPRCGDYQPLGGPAGSNTPGDLTGTVYGADRTGGSLAFIARDRVDHGTIWAATSAGRIFVTHNADATDPATVVWHRIDNATSPTRFPSSIYPDPANPGHAWVGYSGYNAATPTTPGHVFDVQEGGTAPGSGVFRNLNVESGTSAFPTPGNDGDLPVADVVRDDLRHKLYVATDFGVLRGDADGRGGWRVTKGLPRFEVTHLAIEPSSREPTCTGSSGRNRCPNVLFAATHSQGIWVMRLGGGGR